MIMLTTYFCTVKKESFSHQCLEGHHKRGTLGICGIDLTYGNCTNEPYTRFLEKRFTVWFTCIFRKYEQESDFVVTQGIALCKNPRAEYRMSKGSTV